MCDCASLGAFGLALELELELELEFKFKFGPEPEAEADSEFGFGFGFWLEAKFDLGLELERMPTRASRATRKLELKCNRIRDRRQTNKRASKQQTDPFQLAQTSSS